MTDLEKIAGVMKAYRLKKKIKASELAEKINLSRQNFYNYESGGQLIQLTLWLKWCRALGIKPRSAIERVEEELSGTKRSHISKKQQAIIAAKKLLESENILK